MRRSVRRITIGIGSSLAAIVAMVAVAGMPLYVFPPAGDAAGADLIYVIGPPKRERVAVERELRREGVAPLSLYSVEEQGGWSAGRLPVCREEGVECVHPKPFTTNGEVAYLAEFAEERGIERTIMLTFTPHVARTRFIIEKCFDGQVEVVAVQQNLNLGEWIYQYAYQTAAFYKAWVTPCADTTAGPVSQG
jgi:hypothetical protein